MQRTKNVDKVNQKPATSTPRQSKKTMLKYLFIDSEQISKTRMTKKRTKVRKLC